MSGTNGNTAPAPAPQDRMLVALENFTCELDGETIELRAGLDRVGADHSLAARFPDRFGPAGGIGGGERSIVHRMREHGVPRASNQMTLEDELRKRTMRLADLARKEQGRPLPPTSDERFWSSVDQQLERVFPEMARRRQQAEQSEAMLDALEAARARTLAEERESISSWLDD